MAIYAVTTSNWNDATFWSTIDESAAGHSLDFSGLTSTYRVEVSPDGGTITLTDGSSTFTVGDASFAGTPDATLGGATLLSYFTSQTGGDGVDTLNGTASNDTIVGGDGGDELSGAGGDDSISGGGGDDRFVLEDGYGNDTISGGSTGETDGDMLDLSAVITDLSIDLSAGTVTGADGTVTFTDIERITLGGANDTLVMADGVGDNVVVGFKSPGDNGDGTFAGNDLIDVTALSGIVTTDTVTVTDTNGDGTGDTILTFPGGETLTLVGVPPALIGSSLQLQALGIPAGANDYVVEGSAGDDTIDAAYAADPEGDRVDNSDNASGTQSDVIVAAGGDDSVEAGAGRDTIYGGSGGDTIHGGTGADQLLGGTGDDSLLGGDDEDTIRFDDGFGNDTVVGGEGTFAGSDDDILDFSNLSDAVVGGLSGSEAGLITAGTNMVSFTEIERLILTEFADRLDTSGVGGTMTISGGDGDDTFLADNGDDELQGGSGSDLFQYTSDTTGDDTIDGGDEGSNYDQIDLSGLTSAVDVTFGSNASGDISVDADLIDFSNIEELILTSQNDTVDGAADTLGIIIDAGDGDDSVDGGDGTDSLQGGAGSDTLQGGSEDDTLRGGEDGDSLVGGEGDDSLFGDEGDDTVLGNGGADSLEAGSGNDLFYGLGDDDWVNGDYGNDTLYGGRGNDFVRGSFDNDSLFGGEGDDYVWGGWGDDTIVLEDDFGNDTISGEDQDQTVGDTLDLSLITTALQIDLTDANPEIGTVTDGSDTASFEEIETIILSGARDIILLSETSGVDSVTGFAAPTDNLDGTFTANDRIDISDMTSDGDMMPVFSDDVVVTDTVGDGTGDAILTFPGGQSLTLIGVLAADVSSVAQLEAMGIPPRAPDGIVQGSSGNDLIDAAYVGDPTGDRIDNADNDDGDDADSVVAGSGDDTVQAGAGRDTIEGGEGDDLLDGQEDDDTIFGNGGDDTFVQNTNHANDQFVGGETNEVLGDHLDASALTAPMFLNLTSAESGSLTQGTAVTTFSEIERVTLGSGDDRVTGSTENDSVSTGQGADQIDGEAGDDWFDIGIEDGANDTISLVDGDGADTIVGFEAPLHAGAGIYVANDQLDVSLLTLGDGVTSVKTPHVTVTDTVGDGSGDAVLTFPGGESLTLIGVTVDQISSDAQLEAIGIPAASPNYIVEGTSGADSIGMGYVLDPEGDLIDSADNLAGTDSDVVMAGAGDDTIDARGAADSVEGEAGDDTFLIDTSPGNDTLVGGETGETVGDLLDATSMTGAVTLTLGTAESGTLNDEGEVVTFSEIERIALGAGNDTLAGSAEADSVSGGGGADSLAGNGGDDTLSGGTGADILIGGQGTDSLNGGTGADTLAGGAGNDVLHTGGADFSSDVVVLADDTGNDTVTGFEVPTSNGDGTFSGVDLLDVSGLTNASGDLISVEDVTVTDTIGDGSGDAILTFPSGASLTMIGVNPSAVSSPAQLAALGIPAILSDEIVTGTGGNDLINLSYVDDPEGDMVDSNDNRAGTNDDTINAGDGNDTINGGQGNDSLSGQADADRFVLSDGQGNDTIDGGETVTFGSDLDVIDARALSGQVTVTYTGTESGTLTDGISTITFSGIEQIETNTGNDTIDVSVSGASASISSGNGDDELLGGVSNDTLDGGAGDDSIFGGAGNDSLIGGDGADTLLGGTGDDIFGVLAAGDVASGGDGDDTFTVRMSDMGGGSASIDGGETGEVLGDVLNIFGPATVSMTGAEDGTVSWVDGSTLTFTGIESVNFTACFTAGTMIRGMTGDIPVEQIVPGQRILTRDSGFQKVAWAGGRSFDQADLRAQPHLAPVLIPAGALGNAQPSADLLVSPQHRMLMADTRCAMWLGTDEVLVAAKDLIGFNGIQAVIPEGGAHYVHILFEQHEVVLSNGAWSESFQPGDLSLSGLDSAQRNELLEIFPGFTQPEGIESYAAARVSLRPDQARALWKSGP